MAGFVCEVCGKSYKSKRSLRRHQRKVHGDEEGMPLEAAPGVEASEEGSEAEGVEAFSPKVLERALADLGIDREDVMSYRVYPDRVVVIQGPTGFKRVWRMPTE